MITFKISMVTTQDYCTQTLIVKCMKLKLKMFSKDSKNKFDFSNYLTGIKYYDGSNKLVDDKMKD